MFKKLLLFVGAILIAFTVGFMAYSYQATILNHLGIITQPLQSAISTAQTAWANIPEPYKAYTNLAVVGGVPTALMMFFAWAKMRWQRKAVETQLQASQLQGEKLDATQQIMSLKDDLVAKEQRIQQLESQVAQSPASALAEAQNLVAQKQQEVIGLQGQVQALHDEIARLKVQVREVTVVK